MQRIVKTSRKVVVILNNVRSSENVGSIFRTADAAGVSKIILTGYTPAPTDRFGRENRRINKTSLGAEENMEWEKVEKFKKVAEKLRTEKFQIIAIEQDKKSVSYKKLENKTGKNIALVFGNEVSGLSKKDLDLCDFIAEIPMKGHKESLNVSVAAGIILFSLI